MRYRELILEDVPEMSTETVYRLLDLLYALSGAIENQYFSQIRCPTNIDPPPVQYDLFKASPEIIEFNEPLPGP